jgi:Divergent InlB B-repeat domain
MTNSRETTFCNLATKISLGIAVIAMFFAMPAGHAQTRDPILPKLSVAKSNFFHANPEAWNQFVAGLPRRPLGLPQATRPAVKPQFGGTWTAVTPASPDAGLCNPLLLTDGTVLVHDCSTTPNWYKLTPDSTGNYATGTWSTVASLPSGYGPQYNASAVLPDGRVIIEGGEYNINCNGSNEAWTSLGAIYDPVGNTWTSVTPPSGTGWLNTGACGVNNGGGIGDAPSIVLPDGTFMLGACCAEPPLDALFNPTTLGWTSTGVPSSYQNEQGYTLLQNGNVLTIDVWNPPAAQAYNQATGTWSAVASTPVSLIDPKTCGNYEIGPAVTRPDGTVVAFGGNTGCTTPATDPTAIYTPSSNSWVQGPDVPSVCGSSGMTPCDLADAPASLLPNGNVLFAASSGYGQNPTHFFEFTSANAINQVSDPLFFAGTSAAYYYNFLMLPNGQIFMTDFSNVAEVYVPAGGPNSSWAPTITSVPSCVVPGTSYSVSGTQLHGLSQGAAYGDDVQGATNYPLVQIVNTSSGKVYYARTTGFSTMSIAPGQAGSANFAVPGGLPTGAATLYVIANGIASIGQAITVNTSCAISQPTLQVAPTTAISSSGTQGGPFSPSSFSYMLSASSGSLNYSITNVPSWLTASSSSGTVTTSQKTITFSVNTSAKSLAPHSYVNSINFNNTSTGQGNTSRVATLNVNPKQFTIKVSASPAADGTVSGGGSFAGGSQQTVTATPKSGFDFLHWAETGKVVSTSESYTFTVTGNATLIADFAAPKKYTVTVRASPTADGTVSGGGTFVGGSPQTVTATPNGTHSFVHWTQNRRVVSTSESYTFTLSANVTLVAIFR